MGCGLSRASRLGRPPWLCAQVHMPSRVSGLSGAGVRRLDGAVGRNAQFGRQHAGSRAPIDRVEPVRCCRPHPSCQCMSVTLGPSSTSMTSPLRYGDFRAASPETTSATLLGRRGLPLGVNIARMRRAPRVPLARHTVNHGRIDNLRAATPPPLDSAATRRIVEAPSLRLSEITQTTEGKLLSLRSYW
jgi:hypothetical protein